MIYTGGATKLSYHRAEYGSLQSLDRTDGLYWWTGLVDSTSELDWSTSLKIVFMLTNENSPVELHLET